MDDGRARMQRFIEAVEKGETPDVDDQQLIADSFRKILSGENPKLSLAISRERGRPVRKVDVVVEDEFFPIFMAGIIKRAFNLTKYKVIKNMTKVMGINITSMKRYYKKHEGVASQAIAFLKSHRLLKEELQKKGLVMADILGRSPEELLKMHPSLVSLMLDHGDLCYRIAGDDKEALEKAVEMIASPRWRELAREFDVDRVIHSLASNSKTGKEKGSQ